jgi:hypothetical protein
MGTWGVVPLSSSTVLPPSLNTFELIHSSHYTQSFIRQKKAFQILLSAAFLTSTT